VAGASVGARFSRIAGTLAGLAGLGAIVAVFLTRAVLDPGRTTAQPPSALTSSSLSAALALTDDASVRVATSLAIAAIVLLVVFSIQLSTRLGPRGGARPRSSTFVVVVGALIAAMLAVDWGLGLALGDVAVARDVDDTLVSYFVWGWWQGQLSVVLFLCLMVVVAACGLHGIVAARLARWSTLVLAGALAVFTAQGTAGLGLLAGGIWVAGLSVGMTIETAVGPAGAAPGTRTGAGTGAGPTAGDR
jgi:hypothetical protein